jgi:hypothetical protein
MGTDPGEDRLRLDAVVHEITKTEADVVRFSGDRFECGPVGVKVGDDENTHGWLAMAVPRPGCEA